MKEAIFQRLKHSLQLVANPPDLQPSLLPSRVGRADELALDFDQWRETVLHNYSAELARDQMAVLTKLEDKFKSMGKELWTDDAVRSDQMWTDVRSIAAKAPTVRLRRAFRN